MTSIINFQTQVIDQNFDVQARLADLLRWQTEWKRRDGELEAITDRLNSDRPHELQLGMHIGNLRHRLETTITATPLEVRLEIIKKDGFAKLRQHLVKQFVALSKEQKKLWLNNLFFILTPQLRLLLNKIENLCNYRTLGQGRNVLLGGPSGMGKSTLLNWLAALNSAQVEEDRNIVKIIKVDAPAQQTSSKALFQRIIMDLGRTYKNSSSDELLLNKVVVLMQQCRVSLLEIDEIEHITKDILRRRLLELSNLSRRVPIICASCDPHLWVEGDNEVAGRWQDYIYLQPYKGEDLILLLSFIDLVLPFSGDSLLAASRIPVVKDGVKEFVDGSATIIEQLTGGILRDIMMLILDASLKAINRDKPALTPELLHQSWKEIQTGRVKDVIEMKNLRPGKTQTLK